MVLFHPLLLMQKMPHHSSRLTWSPKAYIGSVRTHGITSHSLPNIGSCLIPVRKADSPAADRKC